MFRRGQTNASKVKQVESVIRALTQTPPSIQRAAVEAYFTRDAAFTHPFCRTGSFDGSRFFVRAIYRWYKIMSPHIDLTVHSIGKTVHGQTRYMALVADSRLISPAYDPQHLVLYVNLSQIFRIWAIPFHSAHVNLTTVLHLTYFESSSKYYINSQNDLYQVNEFVRFVWPGGLLLVWFWQVVATLMCLVGAVVFWPISWLEEHGSTVEERAAGLAEKIQDVRRNVERKAMPEDALMGKSTNGQANPRATRR